MSDTKPTSSKKTHRSSKRKKSEISDQNDTATKKSKVEEPVVAPVAILEPVKVWLPEELIAKVKVLEIGGNKNKGKGKGKKDDTDSKSGGGKKNHWVGIKHEGAEYSTKFYIDTPPLSVYDPRVGGSGKTFKNSLKTGQKKLKLYADRSVIEENIMNKYGLKTLEELENHKEALHYVDKQYKEASDFVFSMYGLKESLIKQLYDMGVCTDQHCRAYIDAQVSKEMTDDMNNGTLKKPEYYKEKKESQYWPRYLINGFFPPYFSEDEGSWNYTSPEDFLNFRKSAQTQFEVRQKSWNPPSKFIPLEEQAKKLQNAKLSSEEHIAMCKQKNLTIKDEKRKWTFETAKQQLELIDVAEPLIYEPLIYKNPRSGMQIPLPWDGTPIKNGDLVASRPCFKITKKDGVVYIRLIMSEIVIHYQCDVSPVRKKASGLSQYATIGAGEMTSILSSDFKMPDELFADPNAVVSKDDDEDDEMK